METFENKIEPDIEEQFAIRNEEQFVVKNEPEYEEQFVVKNEPENEEKFVVKNEPDMKEQLVIEEQFVIKHEPDFEEHFVVKNEQEDEFESSAIYDHSFASEATVDIVFKSEIDIEPTFVRESNIDLEPKIVVASRKLYDIEVLREFGDVPFVIKRMDAQDFALSYAKAVSSAETVLKRLHRKKVPMDSGIALRIANHTPSSCILILAILNHKCYFYYNDKMMLSKALHSQMCRAGIDYLIVNGHMPVGALYFEQLDYFVVYNEEYKLFKLKHTDVDPPNQAIRPLPANMCYAITTTGTTGTPKLIHVPYECIAPNIMGLSQKLNISMADIIYLGTPCTFDPSVVELFLALQNGAAVLITQYSMRESPKRVLNALFPASVTTPGITVLQMTPSLFRQFGANAIRERVLNRSSTLRVLLLGGEAFPSYVELASWMEPQVLKQKHICNIYGITEISCWSMMHVLQTLPVRSIVPIGRPIDDETLVRIVGRELYLGSATRRCYIPEFDNINNASWDKNAKICYRATGDLVRRFKDGSIVYEERANDVVKRAGNRICLGIITRKVERCLHSSELASCLWQEDLQKLICCIRSLEPKTKVQQRAQTFEILCRLSAAEQPDRFVYLQHFPCNTHGKLDKELLLKECTLSAQPAQDILKSYLHDRLECVDSSNKKQPKKQRIESISSPSNPSGYDLSFRQAGGSSFHAITLCREIGLQMCIDDEQRHLFELLLDENVPLRSVLLFLDKAKLVSHNTKLKAIEPPLSSEINAAAGSSGSSGSLVITRFEKPAINFKFHWRVNFHKCVDSPVAQYGSRYISVGGHSKCVRTLDAETGQELSILKLPDRIECKVTFINEQLAMVGCYDGHLYGFNPLNGEMEWNVQIGGMIKAQPLLSADGRRIIVCSYGHYNVKCLSTDLQHVIWCMRIGTKAIFASPMELPKQQAVIFCTLDGGCTRVSLVDGSVQWAKKCKEPFFATPVLLDSSATIFLCAEVIGRVHAFNVNNGDILATYTAEGNIFSSLVVKAPPTHMGHTFVLFGCIDQHVYCLRCRTSTSSELNASFELHWKVDVGGSVYATPTILTVDPNDHLVFSCSTDGRVVLTNLGNGQLQWSYKLPGEIFSSPCYIERLKRVYLGSRDNFLYCLGI